MNLLNINIYTVEVFIQELGLIWLKWYSLVVLCLLYLDGISQYIKLSRQREIYDLVVRLTNLYGFYPSEVLEKELELLHNVLENFNYCNYILLERTVFVTHALYSFVDNIRVDLDGSVNQGPPAWRGKSDSLIHTIDSIDTDFRRNMNRHIQWHVYEGNIPINSLIGRCQISYQNIHLNTGYVRWYYTKKEGIVSKIKLNQKY